MAIIKRIRSMTGVGVLADKTAKDNGPDFLKVNLIYGFNGSGKSTLSRVFACLQQGSIHPELPDQCAFELELDDGATYGCPKKLQGLEERICVFNTDFVARNLQWDKGTASSIFYLSQEQADSVAKLKETEKKVPIKAAELAGLVKTAKASNKGFSTYCTERAKTVHGARRLGTRKYEAPKLKADYANETFCAVNILPIDRLTALQGFLSRTAPPPPLGIIELNVSEIGRIVSCAIDYAGLSLGAVLLRELEEHPKMVSWIKDGHEYHVANNLQTCLFCQSALTDARKDELAGALDDKISRLIKNVGDTKASAESLRADPTLNSQTLPKSVEFDPSFQAAHSERLENYEKAAETARLFLDEAIVALTRRLEQPTKVAMHKLPAMAEITAKMENLQTALCSFNDLIVEHNGAVENFTARQDEASFTILRHFLAEGHDDFSTAKHAADADALAETNGTAELRALNQEIIDLKAKVRAHGPAAAKITRLVHDYLGHTELTIIAADQGYLLFRNGKAVRGQPSEGEKTAIALCYFLTTLEAEGRSLKNLIVVVDDPISSLDTKAMNYACTLVLKKLEKAGQLFVLTHNQHCMNEFKKAWKSAAYPKNRGTEPTGRLLYMDVQLPAGSAMRSANIAELSHLLREYDSDYHFLCQKLFEFDAAGDDHSPTLLLMPNAMRRVLEIFLAFKVPGTAPIKDKLKTLTDRHENLDQVRVAALERLFQVESHSSSLDGLIGHSPMVVEEVRQTCSSLLNLMTVTDEAHTYAMKKQCKAT